MSATIPLEHARDAYDVLAPHYDDFTAHHRYPEWTASLLALARRHGLTGTRLLDLACGTGKSFAPFLERGFEVTACDVSEGMLVRARARAGGRARVVRHDIRELPALGEFDLVLCLCDALNYLLSEEELARALAGARRNLAPRGVLLFDLNTLCTYRTFFASTTVVQRPGRVLVWQGEEDRGFGPGGVAQATLSALVEDDGPWWSRVSGRHCQRHHPEASVRCALARAGFAWIAVCGQGLDGEPHPGLDEERDSKAVYVARTCAPETQERR